MKKLHEILLRKSRHYANWHQSPSHSKTHWALFLGIAVLSTYGLVAAINYNSIEDGYIVDGAAAVFLSTKKSGNAPERTLEQYNEDLLNISHKLSKSSLGDKISYEKRLEAYARARKAKVIEKMETDPGTVYREALPIDRFDGVSMDILENIEQPESITGTFEHVIAENFETGDYRESFHLIEEETGEFYDVYIEGEPEVSTSDIVTIDGVVLEKNIATTKDNIELEKSGDSRVIEKSATLWTKIKGLFGPDVAHAQSTTVQRKTAVIMVNWQNNQDTSRWNTTAARDLVFTGPRSTKNFMNEVSFGQLELVGHNNHQDGDVYGWVTIPYDDTGCSVNSTVYDWADAADAAVEAQYNVDMSVYQQKIYLLGSGGEGCPWAGLGTIGGNPGRSWIDYDNTNYAAHVAGHEVGHNLGLRHAGAYRCYDANNNRVTISNNCSGNMYGDPYDAMGNLAFRHFSGYLKGQTIGATNWLQSSNKLTIDRLTAPDGTYTIAPIEQSTNEIQSLRIPRNSTEYYYVEFRQPIGFDSTIESSAQTGVFIRIARDYSVSRDFKILDNNPQTTTFNDAALGVGKTFSDTTNNIHITTLSTSPSGAVVRVFFDGQPPAPCIRANPSLIISPTSRSVYPGDSASFSYTITNNDSSSCPTSSFRISQSLSSGLTQTPTNMTHSLAPGASSNGSFLITVPDPANMNSFTFTQTITNTSISGYSGSAQGTLTILTGDNTPPTVAIIEPQNGGQYDRGRMKITANASDSAGIAEISLLFDGEIISTCYDNTSCNSGVHTNSMSDGAHIVSATAFDTSGNIATTSITVYHGTTAPPPPPSDTTPPTVSITSPADGITVTQPNSITINTAAQDVSGISNIQILLDGSQVETCQSASCSNSLDSSSVAVGNHTITARATDNANNTGQTSIILVVQAPAPPNDTTPPTTPILSYEMPSASNNNQHKIRWTASTDTESGIKNYVINYMNPSLNTWNGYMSIGNLSVDVSGFVVGTQFRVRAVDNANNSSPYSNIVTRLDDVVVYGCTDPTANNYDPNATDDDGSCEYDDVGDDTTPPTAPVLTYEPPSASNNNRHIIKWTASTDSESGVSGYQTYWKHPNLSVWWSLANGGASLQEFDVSNRSTPGTQFKVQAIDNAGNVSEFSNIVEI